MFYLNVSEEKKSLRNDITLLDLPHSEDVQDYRFRLAGLLNTINSLITEKQKPKAVLLDIYFSKDDRGIDTLQKAIEQLRTKFERRESPWKQGLFYLAPILVLYL